MSSIPNEWNRDRLKDVTAINASALPANTDPDYEFDYLEISNVNYNGVIDKNAIEKLRYEDAPSRARRRVRLHDILISSVRPNLQAVAFIDDERPDFVCSTGFNVVRPTEHKMLPRFTYYSLISEGAKQHFESTAKGVGYPAVDDKDFGSFVILLPPLPEQQRIAAYLDASCAAIDAAVAAKRRQIEVLIEVRRSTIQAAVTKGMSTRWPTERLKDISGINIDSLASDIDPNYEFDYLEISNVNIDGVVSKDAIERLRFEDAPSRARRRVAKNATLISSVRPNLQAVAFIDGCHSDVICSTGFNVVQPFENKLRPKFVYYFIISEGAKQYLEATAKGVGYPAVDDKDFGSLLVPIPPMDEQVAICELLDKKITEIKILIREIENQITVLTNYRKSLIHECVTGQRRITEVDLNRIKAHGSEN